MSDEIIELPTVCSTCGEEFVLVNGDTFHMRTRSEYGVVSTLAWHDTCLEPRFPGDPTDEEYEAMEREWDSPEHGLQERNNRRTVIDRHGIWVRHFGWDIAYWFPWAWTPLSQRMKGKPGWWGRVRATKDYELGEPLAGE